MDELDIGATLAMVGVANASVGTMVQLASQGMFERSQRIAPKVSSMRHSKYKKLVGEEFSLLHLVMECNALFQQVFVEKHGKKKSLDQNVVHTTSSHARFIGGINSQLWSCVKIQRDSGNFSIYQCQLFIIFVAWFMKNCRVIHRQV